GGYMARELKDKSIPELLHDVVEVMHSGRKPNDIKKELIEKEISPEIAEDLVEKAREMVKEQNKNGAGGTILLGAVLAGLGIIISMASYSSTSNGRYVIMSGLIIGGGWLILK